jgi:hypothetical protein
VENACCRNSDALPFPCLVGGIEDELAKAVEVIGVTVGDYEGVKGNVLARRGLAPKPRGEIACGELVLTTVNEQAMAARSRDEAGVALAHVDESEG